MIGGSKFEHNDYTNFEYQPTVRLVVDADRTTFDMGRGIAGSARAHPGEQRFSGNVAAGGLHSAFFNAVFPRTQGNPGLRSEELLAYEMGIRVQATERFSWDLAMFYNQYDRLFGIFAGYAFF